MHLVIALDVSLLAHVRNIQLILALILRFICSNIFSLLGHIWNFQVMLMIKLPGLQISCRSKMDIHPGQHILATNMVFGGPGVGIHLHQ